MREVKRRTQNPWSAPGRGARRAGFVQKRLRAVESIETGSGAQAPSVPASSSNKVNVAPRAPRSWQISERGTVILSLRSLRGSAANAGPAGPTMRSAPFFPASTRSLVSGSRTVRSIWALPPPGWYLICMFTSAARPSPSVSGSAASARRSPVVLSSMLIAWRPLDPVPARMGNGPLRTWVARRRVAKLPGGQAANRSGRRRRREARDWLAHAHLREIVRRRALEVLAPLGDR